MMTYNMNEHAETATFRQILRPCSSPREERRGRHVGRGADEPAALRNLEDSTAPGSLLIFLQLLPSQGCRLCSRRPGGGGDHYALRFGPRRPRDDSGSIHAKALVQIGCTEPSSQVPINRVCHWSVSHRNM